MTVTQDADCCSAVNISPQQFSQPFEVLNVKVMDNLFIVNHNILSVDTTIVLI